MHIDPETKYACWYFSQAPPGGASCGGVDQFAKNRGARTDIIGAPAIPACPRDREPYRNFSIVSDRLEAGERVTVEAP